MRCPTLLTMTAALVGLATAGHDHGPIECRDRTDCLKRCRNGNVDVLLSKHGEKVGLYCVEGLADPPIEIKDCIIDKDDDHHGDRHGEHSGGEVSQIVFPCLGSSNRFCVKDTRVSGCGVSKKEAWRFDEICENRGGKPVKVKSLSKHEVDKYC